MLLFVIVIYQNIVIYYNLYAFINIKYVLSSSYFITIYKHLYKIDEFLNTAFIIYGVLPQINII